MPIFPACPDCKNSRAEMLCGATRRCVPTCTTRSAARAAFTIASPSITVCEIGFSTYTCAPEFTAAMVISACQWSGVALMTICGFSFASMSRKSV